MDCLAFSMVKEMGILELRKLKLGIVNVKIELLMSKNFLGMAECLIAYIIYPRNGDDVLGSKDKLEDFHLPALIDDIVCVISSQCQTDGRISSGRS